MIYDFNSTKDIKAFATNGTPVIGDAYRLTTVDDDNNVLVSSILVMRSPGGHVMFDFCLFKDDDGIALMHFGFLFDIDVALSYCPQRP